MHSNECGFFSASDVPSSGFIFQPDDLKRVKDKK